jgi:hypothetical protein
MKILFAVLAWLAGTAVQAHESLVPHSHPHGVSMLPSLDTVACALFAFAAALFAYWKIGRTP